MHFGRFSCAMLCTQCAFSLAFLPIHINVILSSPQIELFLPSIIVAARTVHPGSSDLLRREFRCNNDAIEEKIVQASLPLHTKLFPRDTN